MSTIVLDFNKPLLFLDGKPINDIKLKESDPDVPIMLNKQLAVGLGQSQNGGIKVFHWAIDLYKEGKLTLDQTDRNDLKKRIDELNQTNLVKGRFLEVIEEAEQNAKTPATE